MPASAISLSDHFAAQLASRIYPKTLCPSEIARSLSTRDLAALGVSSWRDLMPRMRELAFEARDRGDVEILQRGEVVGADVSLEDVRGPIRIRKTIDRGANVNSNGER